MKLSITFSPPEDDIHAEPDLQQVETRLETVYSKHQIAPIRWQEFKMASGRKSTVGMSTEACRFAYQTAVEQSALWLDSSGALFCLFDM